MIGEGDPPAGLLLGVSDGSGRDLGLGLLLGCAGSGTIDVLSPLAEREIGHIVPGMMRLDGNFVEKPITTSDGG